MSEGARRAAVVIAALAASGCGTFASSRDYAAYRATRTAPTFGDRLRAADRYLTERPEGAFKAEVRAYFDRAEPVFYAAKQGSAAGLEEYLRVLPEGPHRREASEQLLRAGAEKRRGDELARDAGDVTARLDRAAAERSRAQGELGAWVGRFLDARVWSAPLSEAKAELIVPWSLWLPAPVCASIEPGSKAAPPHAARRCAKILELPYSVPAPGGGAEERQATIEVAMIQDAAGRPLEVTIGGPELFARVEETFSVRASTPEDRERRAAAQRRAVEIVRAEAARSGAGACAEGARGSSGALLDLRCSGYHVVVRAAASAADDDVVVITPR